MITYLAPTRHRYALVLGSTPVASSQSYQALEAYCRLLFPGDDDARGEFAEKLYEAGLVMTILETRAHGSA